MFLLVVKTEHKLDWSFFPKIKTERSGQKQASGAAPLLILISFLFLVFKVLLLSVTGNYTCYSYTM